jgi:hypothetical protein
MYPIYKSDLQRGWAPLEVTFGDVITEAITSPLNPKVQPFKPTQRSVTH